MSERKFYLKPNIVLEPLVDRWYAWTHLIAPQTCALNVIDRHLKIMKSYVMAPDVHRMAVKNPKMLGGPFMDYEDERKQDVIDLIAKTESEHAELIEFGKSIKALQKILQEEAKGYSLKELYQKVPDPLKGLIELYYDLDNNASFRFFEPLLYASKYFKKASQSIAIWETANDERPFVLSTPRLDEDDIFIADISFDHEAVDLLHSMKRFPQPESYVNEILDVPEDKKELFQSFFTEEEPLKYEKYEGDQVRMRYFGHACILIETKDISILVDPIVSYYGYETEVDRFSDFHIPDTIDYVLITHNHQDHVLFETLLSLRHKIKNLVIPSSDSGTLEDPSLELVLRKIGFNNIHKIREMETLNFGGCEITGIPFLGEHADLNIQAKICHHVKFNDLSMLFVADSCNIEPKLYELVAEQIGRADVIFMGMECDGAPLSWVYGPLITDPLPRDMDQTRRLAGSDFEQGKALIDAFDPKEVYVYAMGMEPWLEFITTVKYTSESHPIVQSNKLIDYCRSKGMVSERLFGEKEILYSTEAELTN